MKTILYCIFFVCTVLLTFGCEKTRGDKTENSYLIIQPKSQDIDINNDLITDFRIDYKWLVTNDEPSSGKALIGYVKPLNENKILYKNNVGNLFLLKNDTVFLIPATKMIWSKFQADLVTNNGKDTNWTVISSNHISDFYLGFRLSTSIKNYIGWMKVDINKNSGIISIINKKLTETEFLIIEE
jgi:hypothetical protein